MNPYLFRHKPIVVEARQINAQDWDQVEDIAMWCGGQPVDLCAMSAYADEAVIFVPDNAMEDSVVGEYAEDGDWIVRGPGGSHFIMVDAVFSAIFEPAVFS